MEDPIREIRVLVRVLTAELKKVKNKIIYNIMKKIYDLKYRRATYIPEKGMWVSTVVFPTKIVDDICGVTDVFPGDGRKIDYDTLHSVYIKNASDANAVHRDVVKCVKGGYVLKNEAKI